MGTKRRRRVGAVDQLPSGRWRVRIDDPARSRRVSIGTWETRKEATKQFLDEKTFKPGLGAFDKTKVKGE